MIEIFLGEKKNPILKIAGEIGLWEDHSKHMSIYYQSHCHFGKQVEAAFLTGTMENTGKYLVKNAG